MRTILLGGEAENKEYVVHEAAQALREEQANMSDIGEKTTEAAVEMETYSVPQAARILSVGIPHVHNLCYSGKVTARKVAGKWRIPKAEVERRLQEKQERERRERMAG